MNRKTRFRRKAAISRVVAMVLCCFMLIGAAPADAVLGTGALSSAPADETNPVETFTHLEGCGDDCVTEDCGCLCHTGDELPPETGTPAPFSHTEGCEEGCDGENCTCACHPELEPSTEKSAAAHIESCGDDCEVEDCACSCHGDQPVQMEAEETAEPGTPAVEENAATHIESCGDGCEAEDCGCPCHGELPILTVEVTEPEQPKLILPDDGGQHTATGSTFTDAAPPKQIDDEEEVVPAPRRAARAARNGTGNYLDDDGDSLYVNKYAEDNGDGSYTVTLEQWTEGDMNRKPADITLVLDISGTMGEALNETVTMSAMDTSRSNGRTGGAYIILDNTGEGLNGYWLDANGNRMAPNYSNITFGGQQLDLTQFTNRASGTINVDSINRMYFEWTNVGTFENFLGKQEIVWQLKYYQQALIDGAWQNWGSSGNGSGYCVKDGSSYYRTTSFAIPPTQSHEVYYDAASGRWMGNLVINNFFNAATKEHYRQTFPLTDKFTIYKTPMYYLQDSVAKFLQESVSHDPTAANRISVVVFAGETGNAEMYGTIHDSSGTQWLGISNHTRILVDWMDLTDDSAVAIANRLKSIYPAGMTHTDDGLKLADDLVKEISTKDSSKVVVLFIDGVPNHRNVSETSDEEANFDEDTANRAIQYARDINDLGANTYSLALAGSANGAVGSESSSKFNAFLHYVSSNYPQAESMTNPGAPSYPEDGSSYYLSARAVEELDALFENLVLHITTEPVFEFGHLMVKDTVTQYFDITSVDDIKAYTQEYNGSTFVGDWKDITSQVTRTVDGNTITITDYKFDQNYVTARPRPGTENNYGRKLIVQFKITPKDEFIGGNATPTNTGDSGVYNFEGVAVDTYEEPTVNVPLAELQINAQDKNVYLLGDIPAAELLKGGTVTYRRIPTAAVPNPEGRYTVTFDENNRSNLDWQDDYAEVVRTAINAQGTELTDYTGLTEDTSFTLEATATSRYGDAQISTGRTPPSPNKNPGPNAGPTTAEDPANIYVFVPNLAFKDSIVYFGDNAPSQDDYQSKNYIAGSKDWKHGGTSHRDAVMYGSEPTLMLTYTPDGTKLQNGRIATIEDIPVRVSVGIGNTDISAYTVFAHTDCPHTDCQVRDCTWDTLKSDPLDGSPAFLLHVPTTEVLVTKTVTGGLGDRSKSFQFHVTAQKNGLSALSFMGGHENGSFTLRHGETATLTEVPVGVELAVNEETAAGYTTTVRQGDATLANGQAVTVAENMPSIDFTNDKDGTADTGIFLDSWPYLLLLTCVILGGAGFAVYWHKKRREG